MQTMSSPPSKRAGYPETRLLYISLGNEVWNFGGWGFRIQTHYADGIGEGYIGKKGGRKPHWLRRSFSASDDGF